MSEYLVDIKNERLSFFTPAGEVKALNDVSIHLKEGEVLGIVGESGSGKSVTAYSLMGLTAYPGRLIGGTLEFNGHEIEKMSEKEMRKIRGNEVSIIFQDPMTSLNPVYTIGNQIMEAILLHTDKNRKQAKERARELLQIVDLSEKENAYPAQLSGGQKQRVAIARALATNPKILLCDEATSALDPTTTKSILALLKEINQKYGITIVIITHEMAVVQEIGTHVAIIDHGELAESGTVEEVFTHPKSKAARKLVLMDEDNHYDEMKGQHCVRIVFKSNSSFEPVIANMVLTHRMPVNILQADTKDINGVAHGQMILQLPEDAVTAQKMIQYLKDRNLEVEELDHYVG